MPGSRSSLLAAWAIVLLAIVSITEALPSKHFALPIAPRNSPPGLSGYNVPLSDGSTSLPSPTSALKAIAIGRGTQNYTCTAAKNSSSTTTPTPVAIGAVADLLDASALLSFVPPQEGMQILDILPEYVINFDVDVLAKYSIPLLGHHYFNGAGQPTFDLGSTGLLVAKKVGDIPAPPGACPGQLNQGFGAVDWLALADAGGSRGLSGVYRVITAGGKAPPSCAGQSATIEVQYAALYWFFE